MTRRHLLPLIALPALTGCSSAPEPKAEKKQAEPVTGLHALYGMYAQARSWSPELQVVNCKSVDITQMKASAGKAAVWQAVFASPSLGQKRAYTYSVIDAGLSLRQGIYPDSPSAMGSDARPFLLAGVRTDSEQAWDVALKHAGDYAKKNPDMPITYLLELSRVTNQPVWRVIWGESASSSTFSIVVDATNGEYSQTLH